MLSSIPTKIDHTWEIGFNWRRIWCSWMGMTPRLKFSCAIMGEGGDAENQNCKTCSFLKQLIDNLKLCNISKKRASTVNWEGRLRIFPSLWLWKRFVPSLSHLQIVLESLNLVCRLSRSHKCALWWSRLFSHASCKILKFKHHFSGSNLVPKAEHSN